MPTGQSWVVRLAERNAGRLRPVRRFLPQSLIELIPARAGSSGRTKTCRGRSSTPQGDREIDAAAARL